MNLKTPPCKINHVVFCIDRSGSMYTHASNVVKVTDTQVAFLAKRSQEMDQETRVSVYTFNEDVDCVIYDRDVLRMPSIKGYFTPEGCTNLVGASIQAINESKEISQRYGDHSFLFFIITDGENNRNGHLAKNLKKLIEESPDNYTIACLVPDKQGVKDAEFFGFPADNIQIWDANKAAGYAEVGKQIEKTIETYFQARAQGVRGTKNLFKLDLTNLNQSVIKENLDPIKPGIDYDLFEIKQTVEIRPFVTTQTGNYVKGNSYYELTKREEIQAYKQICIKHRKSGWVYSGKDARQLLGLPDHNIKVSPDMNKDYAIFVQSTSINRKLLPGSRLIVMK